MDSKGGDDDDVADTKKMKMGEGGGGRRKLVVVVVGGGGGGGGRGGGCMAQLQTYLRRRCTRSLCLKRLKVGPASRLSICPGGEQPQPLPSTVIANPFLTIQT